jgi:N-glycosylase/DNA lyase
VTELSKRRNALFPLFGVGRRALGVGRLLVHVLDIAAPDFDLTKTLDSGQVFHWEKSGNGFMGTIGKRPMYVEQRGDVLTVCGGEAPTRSPRRPLPGTIRNYFALDHPLARICASFPDDPVMNAARDFCRGIRIIRQPRWECLATFICSSMKQVAHIRQISHALRRKFGVRKRLFGVDLYVFPTAARIGEASEAELRECALGYRAKNLLLTARLVSSGEIDLDRMAGLSDSDLHASLRECPGVGAKVADCVMLFAYERLGAFPIDVWIERVLREKYLSRARRLNAARLRMFTQRHFGEHGGYAQQYLFHYARTAERNSRKRPHGTSRAARVRRAGRNLSATHA